MEMANHVTIYKTTICATCGAAMRKLDAENIPYTVVNVEDDLEAAALLKRNGFLRAPVFSFGGHLHTIAGLPQIIKDYHDHEEREAA